MTSLRIVDEDWISERELSVFHIAACHSTVSDIFVLESFLDLLKSRK